MRRSLALLMVMVPLAACTSREIPITAEPERPAVPERPAPAPPPTQGNPEVPIPRPANGVLPPGAADRILPAGSAPLVRLLEQGAEPRAQLSYAFVKGAAQKMSMGMDMMVGIKTRGQSVPQTPMPHMTMLFDTLAAEKNAMSELRVDSRLTSATVDATGGQQEQMARALRPQLESMKGLGMSYWVDPKGHVRDVKLDIPSSVPAAAQQLMSGMSHSFESMVTPLPNEQVGVGARWQVVSRINSSGADILQSAIYTLKSRSGARASLDVAIVQLAANDTIHTAQMPAGMSAKVKSWSSGGSGSTQLDLKSVVPEAGSMTLKSAMEIAVQGAQGGDDSTVETTTSVQVGRP